MIIETRNLLPTLSVIKIKFMEEAERRCNQELEVSNNQQALAAMKNEKFNKCNENTVIKGNCVEEGHYANNCTIKG